MKMRDFFFKNRRETEEKQKKKKDNEPHENEFIYITKETFQSYKKFIFMRFIVFLFVLFLFCFSSVSLLSLSPSLIIISSHSCSIGESLMLIKGPFQM